MNTILLFGTAFLVLSILICATEIRSENKVVTMLICFLFLLSGVMIGLGLMMP